MNKLEVACPLCGSNKIRYLHVSGSQLTKGQHGVEIFPGMCDCGLVQLSPRWSKAQYVEYYTQGYDDEYRLELKPDIGVVGVEKNAEEILMRLRRILSFDESMNILDIGSAYGNALKYYRNKIPKAKIYGIESSVEGGRILTNDSGGTWIADDFDDDQWATNYASKFNLITMRHVFEHLLYPNDALDKLKLVLKQGGIIYLSLPDMLHPRIKLRDYDEWFDYWFRVVHPFYYNKYTLAKIIIKNGFDIIDYSEENCELWMIIGLSCYINKNDDFKMSTRDVADMQADVFDRYLKNFSLSANIKKDI
jgi:SAM-dependent methyltransferase